MYNDEVPEKGPAIRLEWWDGVGSHITTEVDLADPTIYSLANAIKDAVTGFGYAWASVEEAFNKED